MIKRIGLSIFSIGFSLSGLSGAARAMSLENSISHLRSDVKSTQNRNAIFGTVINSAHQPVPNLRVELLDDVYSLITTTRTDSTGRFRFDRLSQGAFQVKVITGGTSYVEQMVRVEIFNIRGNAGAGMEQIEITLKTLEESKGSKNKINPGTTFAQNVPDDAKKAYESAVQMLEGDKDTQSGINQLKEAIKLFPDYYLALERLGAEYVRANQFEAAREVLTKAIAVNPNGNLSYYALGVAQFRLKDYKTSIESLRRAVSLAPNSQNAPLTHYYLGLAQIKDGRANDAEASLKKAYELGANRIPPDVHMGLAQIYSNKKQYKEAADELELYLKEAPDARDAESIKNLIKQLRAKAH